MTSVTTKYAFKRCQHIGFVKSFDNLHNFTTSEQRNNVVCITDSDKKYVKKYFDKDCDHLVVTDNIDTFLDTSNNDIAPFKAIMNDMYAKDISKKIKSSLHSRMKDGLYVSGRCPFGYMKDPTNKNHLIINEKENFLMDTIWQGFIEAVHLIFAADPEIYEIVGRSLYVSVFSVVISTVLGIPGGILLGTNNFRGK